MQLLEQQVGKSDTACNTHLREDLAAAERERERERERRREREREIVVIGLRLYHKERAIDWLPVRRKMTRNSPMLGNVARKSGRLQIINPNGADPTAKYVYYQEQTLLPQASLLIIIDGWQADIRKYQFSVRGNPISIGRIKDGSAAAIYGTRENEWSNHRHNLNVCL